MASVEVAPTQTALPEEITEKPKVDEESAPTESEPVASAEKPKETGLSATVTEETPKTDDEESEKAPPKVEEEPPKVEEVISEEVVVKEEVEDEVKVSVAETTEKGTEKVAPEELVAKEAKETTDKASVPSTESLASELEGVAVKEIEAAGEEEKAVVEGEEKGGTETPTEKTE